MRKRIIREDDDDEEETPAVLSLASARACGAVPFRSADANKAHLNLFFVTGMYFRCRHVFLTRPTGESLQPRMNMTAPLSLLLSNS